jgi:hypothetical protein
MDEVVGDVHPLERLVQAAAGLRVADHEVVELDAGGRHAGGRAREAAHRVPLALEARDERGAHVPRDAGDQDLHVSEGTRTARPRMTGTKSAEDAGCAHRTDGESSLFRLTLRNDAKKRAICGKSRCTSLRRSCFLRRDL